jgi:hypothetical protein
MPNTEEVTENIHFEVDDSNTADDPPKKISKMTAIMEAYYNSHREAVRKYQKKNKEALKEKQREYMARLRADDKRFKDHLDRRRHYYKNVIVPKKQELLEKQHEEKPTTLVI